MRKDPLIDEIRAVRHRISERFGHNSKALCDHYREMERNHHRRMLRERTETPIAKGEKWRPDPKLAAIGGPPMLLRSQVGFMALLVTVILPWRLVCAGEGGLKAGDRVRVTAGPAPVMIGDETIAQLEPGAELEVTEVLGKWVGIVGEKEGRRLRGWVLPKHLELLAPRVPAGPPVRPADGEGVEARPSLPPGVAEVEIRAKHPGAKPLVVPSSAQLSERLTAALLQRRYNDGSGRGWVIMMEGQEVELWHAYHLPVEVELIGTDGARCNALTTLVWNIAVTRTRREATQIEKRNEGALLLLLDRLQLEGKDLGPGDRLFFDGSSWLPVSEDEAAKRLATLIARRPKAPKGHDTQRDEQPWWSCGMVSRQKAVLRDVLRSEFKKLLEQWGVKQPDGTISPGPREAHIWALVALAEAEDLRLLRSFKTKLERDPAGKDLTDDLDKAIGLLAHIHR